MLLLSAAFAKGTRVTNHLLSFTRLELTAGNGVQGLDKLWQLASHNRVEVAMAGFAGGNLLPNVSFTQSLQPCR